MRLIDADALLEHMKKIHDKWKMEGHYTPTTDDEIMIMCMPTIDPVKHGRWSRERLPSLSGGTYEVWRCSECQSAFNWRMRYCGHCGARMKGEENV